MLSSNEFKELLSSLKDSVYQDQLNKAEPDNTAIDLSKNIDFSHQNTVPNLNIMKDFFSEKFPESKKIFSSLDHQAFAVFLEKSTAQYFQEQETVFVKGDDCLHYFFLVFGDIMLYSDDKSDCTSKLLKTISGGLVFGHKVKDKLQYFAYAQSAVQIVKILKEDFNQIVEQMNTRKNKNKVMALKKYFPKFRTQSEDSIKTLKEYFFKFEYLKGTKLFVDGEFDEYVYIILSGQCGSMKKVKRINGLKEKLAAEGQEKSHVILELYERGDVIGAYSALKNYKCNTTIEVLSDKLEVYRIFKGDIINLLGGINGKVSEAIKAIDNTQQVGFNIKLRFLEKCVEANIWEGISKFSFFDSVTQPQAKPRHIDESNIVNVLQEALKSSEASKVNNKINDLKASLIPKGGLGGLRKIEKASTLKPEPSKSLNPGVSIGGGGAGLNKLIGKPAMTSNQIASKNKLDALMGMKKNVQSTEEVNAAFQRINERKKGVDYCGSKLLSGLEYSSETVTLEALTKKLDKDEEIDKSLGAVKDKEQKTEDSKKEEIDNGQKEDIEKVNTNNTSNTNKKDDDEDSSEKIGDSNAQELYGNKEVKNAIERLSKLSIESNPRNKTSTFNAKDTQEFRNKSNYNSTSDLAITNKKLDDEAILKSLVKRRSSKLFK